MERHLKSSDVVIEKPIAWIDDYIDRNGLNGKLDRMIYGSIYWRQNKGGEGW